MRVNDGKGCKGTWTVTFTAGTLRSVHTMNGTRREVKAWAERELEYFSAPVYLKKKFHLRELTT